MKFTGEPGFLGGVTSLAMRPFWRELSSHARKQRRYSGKIKKPCAAANFQSRLHKISLWNGFDFM